MRSRRWGELSTPQKLLIIALASVQLSLAGMAWADLAARPAEEINGSKRVWAAIIAINFIGPVLYFWRGRRPAVGPARVDRTSAVGSTPTSPVAP
jgi:hypothetical protein